MIIKLIQQKNVLSCNYQIFGTKYYRFIECRILDHFMFVLDICIDENLNSTDGIPTWRKIQKKCLELFNYDIDKYIVKDVLQTIRRDENLDNDIETDLVERIKKVRETKDFSRLNGEIDKRLLSRYSRLDNLSGFIYSKHIERHYQVNFIFYNRISEYNQLNITDATSRAHRQLNNNLDNIKNKI